MKKRAAVLILAIVLAISSSTTALAAKNPGFNDLPDDHWSYRYVADLCSRGVVNGYPDGGFHPRDSITYGQAFKLILLAIGEDAPEYRPGTHWAQAYMDLALDDIIVISFNARDLDKTPTRKAVAEMVARALELTAVSGPSPYNDCDNGFVVKLYEKGIMEGEVNADGSRSFHPDEPIAREEMAAVVWRMMNVDYTNGMFHYSYYWVDELDGVARSPYTKSQFSKDEKGRVTYTKGYYARGIDVARYQGDIDWEAVAADGIDFAIIKAGARAYVTGALLLDNKFDENMQGAIDAGVDVGAYYFSNCITEEEGLAEAELFLSKLEPYREHITYPVVCDWEYLGGSDARTYGVDSESITKGIAAFCKRVAEAGYTPMIYFNTYCGYIKMDLRDLDDNLFWFAEYTNYPSFRYDFQFWQYSSKGQVDGIEGNVDMNLCFVPFGNGDHNSSAPATPDDSPTE